MPHINVRLVFWLV